MNLISLTTFIEILLLYRCLIEYHIETYKVHIRFVNSKMKQIKSHPILFITPSRTCVLSLFSADFFARTCIMSKLFACTALLWSFPPIYLVIFFLPMFVIRTIFECTVTKLFSKIRTSFLEMPKLPALMALSLSFSLFFHLSSAATKENEKANTGNITFGSYSNWKNFCFRIFGLLSRFRWLWRTFSIFFLCLVFLVND